MARASDIKHYLTRMDDELLARDGSVELSHEEAKQALRDVYLLSCGKTPEHHPGRVAGAPDGPQPAPPLEVEKAYGLLWMVIGDDRKVHEARARLLSLIDKSGQRRGIDFARSKFEMPPIESVLHKLP